MAASTFINIIAKMLKFSKNIAFKEKNREGKLFLNIQK